MGILYGENCMILTSTVFDWSTRVTDGQTDGRIDGWTDGIATAYVRLAYMLSRAKMKLLNWRRADRNGNCHTVDSPLEYGTWLTNLFPARTDVLFTFIFHIGVRCFPVVNSSAASESIRRVQYTVRSVDVNDAAMPSAKMSSLLPHQTYRISVAARTRAGVGVYSDIFANTRSLNIRKYEHYVDFSQPTNQVKSSQAINQSCNESINQS